MRLINDRGLDLPTSPRLPETDHSRPRRGKLKVFLGAAAGVGKTYSMLEEARRRAAEGVDVLVAYAEPHIRPETEALLLGMDVLRHKVVVAGGVILKELDLDAALLRRPHLVLVDELAHTNPVGLRHQKRWQDVAELLDAGINVYTTLNIQHLESVSDLVERMTGIPVRETLPDRILDEADEVELVDTAPDELLERLRQGKAHRRDLTDQELRQFFSKGTLLALRELALRRTAQRVDAQIDDFRRVNAVRETWPTTERILVCVSPSPLSERLVRSGRRLAVGLKAQWIAAYVRTAGSGPLSDPDHERVQQTLRLAEQLGAQVVTLVGWSASEELLAYAQTRNVTKIVIGKPQRPRWRELLFGSVVDELVRGSGDMDVYVIRGERAGEQHGHAPLPRRSPVRWRNYAFSLAVTMVCTAIGWTMFGHFDLSNIVMVYLLGVAAIAAILGRGPAVLASLLGVLSVDFFFVPPRFTLAVADTQYIVTFAVMLAVTLLISTLTDRVREQALTARRRERRTAALLALSGELAASRALPDIATTVKKQIADVFDSQVAIFLPDAGREVVHFNAEGSEYPVDASELVAARWVMAHEQMAGLGTATLPAVRALYLPLVGSRETVGVIGVSPASRTGFDDLDQQRLLEAFVSQSALSIERAKLGEEARQARERAESQLMRNTLLSSVSHDLRTPLAAITGAASGLLTAETALALDARRELAETIFSESERMERLVNNLLDMTRVESGGLQLRKEWQPLQEVIGAALHHLDKRLAQRKVQVNVPADLPLVAFDAIAIEQVLVNLFDNALAYTPQGTPLELTASADPGHVIVQLADHGPGLTPGTEHRVFEKFFRAGSPQAGSARGIGLGLAICRGIIEAHGGRIDARNRTDGMPGAVFRFTIPIEGTPPQVSASD